MISIGYHIRQSNDPLNTISLDQLGKRIKNPPQKFVDFIMQLRSVLSIDTNKYRQMKTQLPYVVAARFNPSFRKTNHFGSTDYFIVDIDHLSDKEIDYVQLFGKLKEDKRVALCFGSPSGDGIKVIFKFTETVYDPAKYAVFYKVFVQDFAQQYNIHQVVDKVTSDVARACFVSFDPNVFFNDKPVCVKIADFIDFENQLQLHELLSMQKETEKEQQLSTKPANEKQELPEDILQQIKDRLNPRLKEKREKKIFVPNELDYILPAIVKLLAGYQIEVDEIKNIHYGKQFKIKMKHLWGELNLFYGKRGFTIVKSTKSGSNEQLTDIAHDVVQAFLFDGQEETT
jgi:hypothetical protein